MSSDGAHQGVSARRAIGTILGGEPPPEERDRRSPDEMSAWLFSATGPPFAEGDDGYDQCARYAGRLFLEVFLTDPSIANAPVEDDYDWEADPDHGTKGMKPEFIKRLGVGERLRNRFPEIRQELSDLGLSGFQWGWAVNAARYCVELPPEPNPAILTF